jgi:hypothetical protein
VLALSLTASNFMRALSRATDRAQSKLFPECQAGCSLRQADYLPKEDVYRCPAGEELAYRYTNGGGQDVAPLLNHGMLAAVPLNLSVHGRQVPCTLDKTDLLINDG